MICLDIQIGGCPPCDVAQSVEAVCDLWEGSCDDGLILGMLEYVPSVIHL